MAFILTKAKCNPKDIELLILKLSNKLDCVLRRCDRIMYHVLVRITIN